MRTTLTLDDDVARMLEMVQKEQHKPFKQVVNEVLRKGLVAMKPDQAQQVRHETPELVAGKCKYPDLDNISDVLAVAEGEDFK
jgi:hypothetical protein